MKLQSLITFTMLVLAGTQGYAQFNRNYYMGAYSLHAAEVCQTLADETYTVSYAFIPVYNGVSAEGTLLMHTDNQGNVSSSTKMLDNFRLARCKMLETANGDLMIAMTGTGAMGYGLYVMRYDAQLNDQWPQMLFFPTGGYNAGGNIDIAPAYDWNNPSSPESYLVLYSVTGVSSQYPTDINTALLKIDGNSNTLYNNYRELVNRSSLGATQYLDMVNSMVQLPDDPNITGHPYAITGTSNIGDQNISVFADILFDGPGSQGGSVAYTRYTSGNSCSRPNLTFDHNYLTLAFTERSGPITATALLQLKPAPGAAPGFLPSFSFVNAQKYWYYGNPGADNQPMAITSGANGTYRISGYVTSNLPGDPVNPNILYVDQATLNPIKFVRYNEDAEAYMYSGRTHTTTALDENYLIGTRVHGNYFGLKIMRTDGNTPETTCGGIKEDVHQGNILIGEKRFVYQNRNLPSPTLFTPAYSFPNVDYKDCNNNTNPNTFKPGSTGVASIQSQDGLLVFPTDISGDEALHIQLPEAGGKSYTCNICNMQGQVIYTKILPAGSDTVEIQPGFTAAGLYMIRIISDKKDVAVFKLTYHK